MKNYLISLWVKFFGETPTKIATKAIIKEEIKTFVPVEVIQVCKCGKAGCKCNSNDNCSTSKEIKKAPLIKEPIKLPAKNKAPIKKP